MLLNLFIKDFGIIEKTEINFGRGLNVLSGETGSGKSIIIEAIQVVAGGRASADYIRAGCEKAVVQMTLDAGSVRHIKIMLSERGIVEDTGDTLVFAREINKKGRSTCRINGQMVTLNVYREISQHLVDIQGQHDQQLLFNPEMHLMLLDAYGREQISETASEVSALYKEYVKKRRLLEDLRENQGRWIKRQETLCYQMDEIDSISPEPGEDENLASEKRKLAGAEKISRLVGEYNDLYGGQSQVSALELTGKSLKALERAMEVDEGLSRVRDLTAGALYQIEEACRDLAAYMDGMEFFPARLEFVEERLALLNRLKKKYGGTLEEVINYREEIEGELSQIKLGDQRSGQLEHELGILLNSLENASEKLTGKRIRAARAMEENIAAELRDLGMDRVKFSLNFSPLEKTGEKGRELVEFHISTNPGEPLRPLARIASGGETSRILLAVKSILAEMEEIPTLIFDEVDTGIGGLTIKSVALKLCKLASSRQVISVTHSSTVASMSHQHLSIRKREVDGRTRAEVFHLHENERMEELARMLGGGQDGGAAMNHARHLLEEARKCRSGGD